MAIGAPRASAQACVGLGTGGTTTECIAISASNGYISDSNPDAYISSGTDFPMPALDFQLANAPCSCTQVTWSLSFQPTWYDADGQAQTGPITVVPTPYATLNQGIDWRLSGAAWDVMEGATEASIQAGGSATVTAQPNDGPALSYTFTIAGKNPSEGDVDAYYQVQNAPWFFGQMLAEESSGHQFVDGTTNTNEFQNAGSSAIGQPCWGGPDGNGISQIDRTTDRIPAQFQSIQNSPYWNWQTNVEDAVADLLAIEVGPDGSLNCNPAQCSYSFYDNQIYQMCANQSGGVPSGGWEYPPYTAGTAECSIPFAAPDTSYGTTTFSYPLRGGTQSYADADTIIAYNGATLGFFIAWKNDAWALNYGGGNYVEKVLTRSAY